MLESKKLYEILIDCKETKINNLHILQHFEDNPNFKEGNLLDIYNNINNHQLNKLSKIKQDIKKDQEQEDIKKDQEQEEIEQSQVLKNINQKENLTSDSFQKKNTPTNLGTEEISQTTIINYITNSNNDLKYRLCNINECLGLPLNFKEIFDNYNQLYRVGVPKRASFLQAVMSIIDPMYTTYSLENKNKLIDQVYILLLDNFNTYFEQKNYRKDGYSKTKMLATLNNSSKIIDRPQERFIADFFQLNIIVIDNKYNKFYNASYTNEHFVSILLLKENDIYESIMIETGNNFMLNIEEVLEKKLTKEIKEERKIKEISYNNEDEKKQKIKLINKMKMPEIIDIANKLEINIIDKMTLKKIKKDILIEKIKECM